MALAILSILFTAIIIIAITIQFLLYKNNNQSKNTVFIINVLFELGLSALVFSSLPSDYTGQRIVAVSLGVLSILAVLVKLKSSNLLVSKMMLSVAIIGSLVQLFS
jgi:hypothetical protein